MFQDAARKPRPQEIRRIAVACGVDDRTLLRFLTRQPMKAASLTRIERGLSEHPELRYEVVALRGAP